MHVVLESGAPRGTHAGSTSPYRQLEPAVGSNNSCSLCSKFQPRYAVAFAPAPRSEKYPANGSVSRFHLKAKVNVKARACVLQLNSDLTGRKSRLNGIVVVVYPRCLGPPCVRKSTIMVTFRGLYDL